MDEQGQGRRGREPTGGEDLREQYLKQDDATCCLRERGAGREASSGVPRGGNGPAMPRRGSQDGWGWGGHPSGQEVPDIGSPISAVLLPQGEMLGKA